MNRRPRLSPFAVDCIVALLLGAIGLIELVDVDTVGPAWANVAGLMLISASIAIRRTRPFVAAAVFLFALLAMIAAGASPRAFSAPFLCLFLLPYAAGTRLQPRPALVTLAMTWVGVTAVWLEQGEPVFGYLFFPGMFATVFWIAGRVVRSRTQLTAELHEAALRAAEDREAEAARAAADERRRIARELHDVVAHSVSMMVVQAGGARRILERDPARAVAAAELIERTGREAMSEMRRLLGVLHPDEHADYAPQPTLVELDALIERARGAGLPVELQVAGERRELPAGLDLAAYRVVQEALTNVVKHGRCAPTEVRVHYRAESVELRISDRGDGAVNSRLGGDGHGLVGMRERVKMYGGELKAGRRRGGGFEVRARLPLEGEEDAALTSGAHA